ncbi:MAG: YCF48-related protein [Candidatus Thorarchaeota archaeon]|nr:YCF48-related protein [Candidatus Thorarchaeota archaeon]
MNEIRRIVIINVIFILIFLGPLGVVGTAEAISHSEPSFNSMQEGVVWDSIEHDYSSSYAVFRDISFINETHGWIVGENGTGIKGGIILHTNDGGVTWNLQLYNETQSFRHIEVIDQNTLWTTGDGGLFYTFNAGSTWNYLSIDALSTDSTISTVEFFNNTYGWTAADGSIFATTNGGMNWESGPSWPFDEDRPRMFHFISDSEVWCIGYYGIYHSTNGGETWLQRFNKGGWAFSFVSNREAWAVADGMLAHYVDGESWNDLPLPRSPSGSLVDPPYFTDILFLDANQGWIAGLETQIAYTNNGGIDWYQQKVAGSGIERIMSLDMINSTHGWATGTWGIILRTSTGTSLGELLQIRIPIVLLLSIFGAGIVMVVITIGGFIFRSRRRRKQKIPEIE